MKPADLRTAAVVLLVGGLTVLAIVGPRAASAPAPADRKEVIFWHFWGGRHRAVVDDIVARFNASQQEHFVRAVAMPGNNLDVKLFLGVAGNDPPDVVNQDDPIVADWAHRGAIMSLAELATPAEHAELDTWLFPAAREMGTYRGRLYALCNALDIRALYYDEAVLEAHGLKPPTTLAELDAAAERIAPPDAAQPPKRYGYLPDPRRIWAWGIVFGGDFYDEQTGRVTADTEPIVRALDWMASYSRRYGAERVVRFRKGDQALPGAAFPLLEGRYAFVMDGQWRVPEIAEAREAARRLGRPEPRIGAVALPKPDGGLDRAGWVNGNFFVVPRGAHNPRGAWAFMKFWSGFGPHAAEAARACAAGGWVPASQHVVEEPRFQSYLAEFPQFRLFVDLAGSPNQRPTPVVPGAPLFQDEIIRAAEDAMYGGVDARRALAEASARVQRRIDELITQKRPAAP